MASLHTWHAPASVRVCLRIDSIHGKKRGGEGSRVRKEEHQITEISVKMGCRSPGGGVGGGKE